MSELMVRHRWFRVTLACRSRQRRSILLWSPSHFIMSFVPSPFFKMALVENFENAVDELCAEGVVCRVLESKNLGVVWKFIHAKVAPKLRNVSPAGKLSCAENAMNCTCGRCGW